jgi:cysteine desulfurase
MRRGSGKQRPIYMDHHATTPVDQRVLDAMLPYWTECYGNAASVDHEFGAEAHLAVERARAQVALLLGVAADEILFTSGATEANNLAILGAAQRYMDRGRHVITCVTEHPSVLDPCRFLERAGWEVTYLPVDRDGQLDMEALRNSVRSDTVLVSVMAANNEIGTIAPLAEIGAIAREHGVIFHTDATQAAAYVSLDVAAIGIDLLSLSAHKIYGPKGVGALYVRRRPRAVRLQNQVHGGGHERGLRSGTVNVPGVVGLGVAAEVARKERETETARLSYLRNHLLARLREVVPDLLVNGSLANRLPNNLSAAIPGVDSRALLIQLRDDVALSSGSACSTTKVEPSHVIIALGLGEERAHCSVRFGLGRPSTQEEVELVVRRIAEVVPRVRSLRQAG